MTPTEIKAPSPIPSAARRTVFLAGSIEMGKAEDWQRVTAQKMLAAGWTVLNPRRDDWDASWQQSIDNAKFREQVEWELDALDRAEAILLYFSPGTQSPISLLELGIYATSPKLTVVCPDGFWRKGNVDIVCARFGIRQRATLADAVSAIVEGRP